jgi:hypothetical protein
VILRVVWAWPTSRSSPRCLRLNCESCCIEDCTVPLSRLTATNAAPATILIRLIVGMVFLSEGMQAFLFPDELGVGRPNA